MAKFNDGKLGGVYYKATPSGVRKYLRFGKISPIPYVLGYDIEINLLIKRTEANAWWTEGVLKPELPIEYPNNPFEIGMPDKKGKWLGELYVGHPTKPITFLCKLQLQDIQETNDYLRPKIDKVEADLIEDVRVISLTTVLAWGIPIAIGLMGVIVAILAIIK